MQTYEEVLKQKLNTLIQSSVEIKSIYDQFVKEIGVLQKILLQT